MLIALDYDGTYTTDPILFDAFIRQAKASGHEIICVTMRYPEEEIHMLCEIIYTSRQAKLPFMGGLGRMPDIWIDDNPRFILVGENS